MTKFILPALILCTSASAFAYDTGYDQQRVVVMCRDASGAFDAGFSVAVHNGGFTGMTLATVSRMNIAGSQALVTSPVVRKIDSEGHPGLIAYSGANVRLVVNTNQVENDSFAGYVKAHSDSEVYEARLFCRFAK